MKYQALFPLKLGKVSQNVASVAVCDWLLKGQDKVIDHLMS